MLGSLRDESVQQELGLTDEQKQKVEELSESARPSRDFFAQFAQLRELSEEERDAKMAEIRQQMEDRRREAENKLKDVLKEEQFTRLQQISLRSSGARGLLQDEIAQELKLTDEQKTQIREVLENREGFRDFRSMTPEDFQRIREERETKALAILSAEQKQAWEKKLGPASAATQTPSENRGPSRSPRRTFGNAGGGNVILPDGTPASRTPTSSFATPTGEGAGAAPRGEVKKLSFNFVQAAWVDVLRMFAAAAGLTIDLTDVPPGTFSYYDPNEYTPTEALDIINGYLLPRGYVLVRRNNFLVSINYDENGVPPNLVPVIKISELPQRGQNELVSIILPLQPGLEAETIAKEVEGLIGPQGKVTALTSSNSLKIQEIGSNLREIVTLLSDISVPESDDTLVFRRFELNHMVASEAERQIRRLFGIESTRNVSRASESGSSSRSPFSSFFSSRFGRGDDNDRDRDSRSSSTSMLQMMQAMTPQVHVSSDPRTNSVLVKAKAADMKLIEEMLEAIDVPESTEAKRIAGNNTPVLRVYTLGEAEAEEVAKTLDAIMPGVVINEDGRNDMIHVMATPLEHEEIEILVQRLDGAGGQTVDVIKLTRTDPMVMSQYLVSLFSNVDRDIAPSIQADPITRSLIVRGSVDQVAQIRKMLLSYGEDGRGVAATGQGRFRTVPVAGRDPERIARMVEGILSESGSFSNEIRIVVPSSRGPVQDLRTPSNTRSEPPAELRRPTRAAEREAGADLRTERARRSQMYMASLKDESAEADPAPAAEKTAPPAEQPAAGAPAGEDVDEAKPAETEDEQASTAPRVNIEVRDGELFMYSADEEALNEVEGLVGELAQQMPVQTAWTVFYLQIADVTEAATLLQQLVPSSSVATTSDSSSSYFGGWGSYSSRYSSRSSAPVIQSLKIIPDVRTNSMFVSGPSDKVREVEQFLRIIDASETPESLRDRLPRTIPVYHADVLQVAQMIRDVYKDYMEDPNARSGGDRDRGGSPFSFFSSSGGSRSSGSSRQRAVRLTLAVDTQASELIVSCDDALYHEISDLVETRDRAAFEAEPSVQVVELNPASAAMVQKALTSLSPKILVSTTGTPPRTSSSTQSDQNRSSSGGSSERSGEDSSRDFWRQMMERRMMEGSRGDSDRGRSDWGRSSGGSSDWRSRFGGFGDRGGDRSRGRD